MNYPKAYIDYLVHFHGDRDFFECHEILEEHWKAENQQDSYWVALIQIAVGLYHQRRGNLSGAVKMLNSSLSKLHPKEVEQLGLNYPRLVSLINQRLTDIRNGINYTDFNLPIDDLSLIQQCKDNCMSQGLVWQSSSPMENDQVIHRHTLRDRSDVMAERKRQLRLRKDHR